MDGLQLVKVRVVTPIQQCPIVALCIIVSLVGIWPTELDQEQTIQTDPIVDSGRKVARVCKSSHFLAYQHKHDAELLVPDDDFISIR